MVNNIGEKIKNLRKKSNVTQEKFAEYLGITFQAVSRWESGICYPDLEMLPAIANYFNVTTDELLGVDISKNKEKIKNIGDLIHKKLRESFTDDDVIDDAIKICRDAIAEFPNNYYLLSWLANCLGSKSARNVFSDEEKEKCKREIISIREHILEDCTDDRYRLPSLTQLIYAYNSIGNKEKALELAKNLPTSHETSDNVLWTILDGDEKLKKGVEDILILTYSIEQRIEILAGMESDNDKDKRIELIKEIIDIIYKDYTNDELNSNDTTGLLRESAPYKAVAAKLEQYAKKRGIKL